MSTHAAIIVPHPEGGWQGIYVHSDGYLEHTGRLIARHYQDGDSARAIVALGDLSALGERLEPKGPHSYFKPEPGTTVAYHRDRGEDLVIRKGPTVEHLVAQFEANGHIYVWNGAGWLHNGEELGQELAHLGKEDA